MNIIIDQIMQFLQFDLAKLFTKDSECCICCVTPSEPHFTESAERCIANIYEPRPRIVNGDEMMEYGDFDDCDENQLAKFCEELEQLEEEQEENGNKSNEKEKEDEGKRGEEEQNECCNSSNQRKQTNKNNSNKCSNNSSSNNSSSNNSSSNSKKNDSSCGEKEAGAEEDTSRAGGDVCTCNAVCKRVVAKIAAKCSSSTLFELREIEERANNLWQTLNMHIRADACGRFPNWWYLKAWQKLPFYWAALSNDILCEDPFENFKRFYIGNNKKTNKRSTKCQTERALIMWHRLTPKQRLPFIMEALISKVGAGKVKIGDEREMQRVITVLQNK